MPEELPRPHRRLDIRPHLRQASRAPAREDPRPPRRSNERRSTTSSFTRKTNLVPPREASPPVASGLPPARSSHHEHAPPPSSLPVCLQEPSWTSPQASAAVAGRLHPLLVENRTLANSSSQIWPSPSSPLPATSMPTPLTCCNLHGRLPLFLRVPKPIRGVRIRSTTLVRLLHGFVLLPSGISDKMNISLDTSTIIAMLVVSFSIAMSRYLPLVCQASQNAMKSL